MSEIFLSYANEDRGAAGALVGVLEAQGWSVWWDHEIPPGTEYETFIKAQLDVAGCVVVLWSPRSVASRWVRAEANAGAERNILVPALIEDCQIPLGVNQIQTARLTAWDGSPTHPEVVVLIQGVGRALRTSGGAPAPKSRPWPRWLLVAGLATPIPVVIVLNYMSMRAVDIALDLRASEVSFALRAPQALLTDPLPLDSLGVTDLLEIVLPPARRYAEPKVLLASARIGDRRGTLNLDVTPFPAGTRVTVGHSAGGSPHDYRLSFEGDVPELSVSVDGPVQVVIPGALNERASFTADRIALRADSGRSGVSLDLTLPLGAAASFPMLDAEGLDFHRIDRIREGARTADPVSSTILSGSVSFPSLRRPEETLDAGEDLGLHGSSGKLSILGLADGAVALRFNGTAHGIRAGPHAMPSLLEGIVAQHRALVVSLAALYVVTVALVAFRRGWIPRWRPL